MRCSGWTARAPRRHGNRIGKSRPPLNDAFDGCGGLLGLDGKITNADSSAGNNDDRTALQCGLELWKQTQEYRCLALGPPLHVPAEENEGGTGRIPQRQDGPEISIRRNHDAIFPCCEVYEFRVGRRLEPSITNVDSVVASVIKGSGNHW
jgi:hypothetical protein